MTFLLQSKLDERQIEERPRSEGEVVRHFVLDDAILLSIVERPLGDDEDKSGTTVVMRGIAGKQVWDFHHIKDVSFAKLQMAQKQARRGAPESTEVSRVLVKERDDDKLRTGIELQVRNLMGT